MNKEKNIELANNIIDIANDIISLANRDERPSYKGKTNCGIVLQLESEPVTKEHKVQIEDLPRWFKKGIAVHVDYDKYQFLYGDEDFFTPLDEAVEEIVNRYDVCDWNEEMFKENHELVFSKHLIKNMLLKRSKYLKNIAISRGFNGFQDDMNRMRQCVVNQNHTIYIYSGGNLYNIVDFFETLFHCLHDRDTKSFYVGNILKYWYPTEENDL